MNYLKINDRPADTSPSGLRQALNEELAYWYRARGEQSRKSAAEIVKVLNANPWLNDQVPNSYQGMLRREAQGLSPVA